MNPRITSIENLIATDPAGRNIFGLVVADQLRLAAQSLRLARRVGIVSGFYIKDAGAGETDGPPGAKVLGQALRRIGIEVDYITDKPNAPIFRALGLKPITDAATYLTDARPTHLVAIERAGRGRDGRYRNMRGHDITDCTAPLDDLFLQAERIGLTTIGIGDGGNEIGMGKVFAETMSNVPHGQQIATTVTTDFCIVAGVSNWGAFGLAGALSVLEGKDLLPTAREFAHDLEHVVSDAGAVDGITQRHEMSSDGVGLAASLRMLESIRRHIAPSPLERGQPLLVGVLGYGESGRAAAALLTRHGHRVRVSDKAAVTVEAGTQFDGVEAGGHTYEFLKECHLIVTSPGVPADLPILGKIHRRGIPVVSELELAYQLGIAPHRQTQSASTQTAGPAPSPPMLIAVTGTVGKRTTVELLQRLFRACGRDLIIGGNRGRPLSALLLEHDGHTPIALAVSSFQLETAVHFRPDIAILLNIDEAHLDRHRTIPEYVRIKSRSFMNHQASDVLTLPFDDDRLRPLARKHQGRTLYVSTRQAIDRGAWLTGDRLRLNVGGTIEELGTIDPCFPVNVLTAVLTARLYGIEADDIAAALQAPELTEVIA